MQSARGLLLLAIAALTLTAPARAACPDVPCDCLGEASRYRAVSVGLLRFAPGPDRPSPDNGFVLGSICTNTANLSEYEDNGQPDITGDLHALATTGEAVTARNVRPAPGDDVHVSGVLATGGGSVSGPLSAGSLDTTGTHPDLALCQQALADMQAASQALAALTPTQTLPSIVNRSGTPVQIVAGPGVNVVRIEGRIFLKQAALEIVLAPTTDAVIVNAKSVTMRRFAEIRVTGGDSTKVLLNFPGRGGAVALKDVCTVEPIVVAPERIVRIGTSSSYAAVLGKRVLLRGAFGSQDVCAAASPSGAFLERAAPF